MKTFGRIVLTILSFLGFFSVAFWIFIYYLGGLGYYYHDQSVNRDFSIALIAIVASFILLIAIVVTMFGKAKAPKIICTVLLIIFIPISYYATILGISINIVLGPNGCSYTEDIANYADFGEEAKLPPHFPDEITDDMNVLKYAYYYKYIDITQYDIYLEVKFADKETMKSYLDTAKAEFSEKGVEEYMNPYNSNYTDVIAYEYWSWKNEWILHQNNVWFNDDEEYKYVEFEYSSITYSYDDLTIIFTYTDVGNDTEIGDNPNAAEYYPKFLERFNVEWSQENNFKSEIIFEDPAEDS